MNCKHDKMLMDEYPDKWECSICGYRIAKLNDKMTPSEMRQIVTEMKEYYDRKKYI